MHPFQEHHLQALTIGNPPFAFHLPHVPEKRHSVTETNSVISVILKPGPPDDKDVKQQLTPTLPSLSSNKSHTAIPNKSASTSTPWTDEGDDAMYWSQFSDDSIMSWGDLEGASVSADMGFPIL